MIKKEIILLFVIMLLSSIGYSLINPFYPEVSTKKGLSESIIGIIFSCFAISSVVAIPIIPYFIKKIGRMELLYSALILEGTCTFLFSFFNLIKNPYIFAGISMITRFAHGFGAANSSTLVYSMAAFFSTKDEIQTNMGYMEIGFYSGFAIGPPLSSFLYYYFGYCFPFLFVSALFVICLFFIEILNHKREERIKEEEEEEIGFFKILFNGNIFPIFMSIMINMISQTFIFPVLSEHLTIKFGFTIQLGSLFLAINWISYFIVLQFIKEISNFLGLKLTILIGHSFGVIGVLLVNPIDFFPQSYAIVIIGLFILGFATAFILIPGLVDFPDLIKADYKISDEYANDLASALFNFASLFGEAIGPTFGSVLTEQYGFKIACIAASAINVFQAVLIVTLFHKTMRSEYGKLPTETQVKNDYQEMKPLNLEVI